MNKYNRVQKFRLDTHQMLIKSKDATFQLMDSIMTTENAGSLAEFSLSPFFSLTARSPTLCFPDKAN